MSFDDAEQAREIVRRGPEFLEELAADDKAWRFGVSAFLIRGNTMRR